MQRRRTTVGRGEEGGREGEREKGREGEREGKERRNGKEREQRGGGGIVRGNGFEPDSYP
jgi:hypothetical protein